MTAISRRLLRAADNITKHYHSLPRILNYRYPTINLFIQQPSNSATEEQKPKVREELSRSERLKRFDERRAAFLAKLAERRQQQSSAKAEETPTTSRRRVEPSDKPSTSTVDPRDLPSTSQEEFASDQANEVGTSDQPSTSQTVSGYVTPATTPATLEI
ncbi:unnamed protein product [Cylicocyclus nassatus]|uniref:Uncharacterized protein n=1 Tax=Cylicocyclus nassatus TaxID=53992 RepID=A0AA36M3P9_CYLNA|nr:unnamed protein product [Cylicocyclus nassatus]